jgi:ribosomal protein L34E
MNAEEMRRVWQERSEVAFAEVTQWREAHPKATLAEIEAVIDSKIMALRAAMIQDTAHSSSARTPSTASTPPSCEYCGHPLQGRGQRKRTLRAQGGQEVTLQREYLTCSHCGNGVFPPGR